MKLSVYMLYIELLTRSHLGAAVSMCCLVYGVICVARIKLCDPLHIRIHIFEHLARCFTVTCIIRRGVNISKILSPSLQLEMKNNPVTSVNHAGSACYSIGCVHYTHALCLLDVYGSISLCT